MTQETKHIEKLKVRGLVAITLQSFWTYWSALLVLTMAIINQLGLLQVTVGLIKPATWE